MKEFWLVILWSCNGSYSNLKKMLRQILLNSTKKVTYNRERT